MPKCLERNATESGTLSRALAQQVRSGGAAQAVTIDRGGRGHCDARYARFLWLNSIAQSNSEFYGPINNWERISAFSGEWAGALAHSVDH